jgi:hypothetical protein
MAASTPSRATSKAACPQGTSPMAQAKNTELDLDNRDLDLDLGEEENDGAPKAKEDEDSISRRIASTKKKLFKASGAGTADRDEGGGEAVKGNSRGKHKEWRPIITPAKDMVERDRSMKKGASFAKGTVFNKKTPPEKDVA